MVTYFYCGNILGKCKVGQVFVIGCNSDPSAKKIEIWLKNGKAVDANVPFHIKVPFLFDYIVRNSFIQGRWGKEELEKNLEEHVPLIPLKPGEPFTLYIFVGNDCFLVSINDRKYCTYKFRLPLDEVKTIEISCDVKSIFQVDHRSTFPLPCPTVLLNPYGRYDFSNDIPQRFRVGHRIDILGVPQAQSADGGQFVVCMLDGDAGKQALHFNPRFGPENVVVINSQYDDLSWQKEERHSVAFPFAINKPFRLSIVMAEGKFQFWVNEKELASYPYCSAQLLDRLSGLKIKGKGGVYVNIQSVEHIFDEKH